MLILRNILLGILWLIVVFGAVLIVLAGSVAFGEYLFEVDDINDFPLWYSLLLFIACALSLWIVASTFGRFLKKRFPDMEAKQQKAHQP